MAQPDYFTKYANFALSRDEEGVLVVRLHTNGGPIVFNSETHRDFPALLEEISLDADNKAMVLTGSGDVFMTEIDSSEMSARFEIGFYQRFNRPEGVKVAQRLLDLPIPVIGVANGPATSHSEYLLLADIHIASERATYGDFAHPGAGVAAGDGVHVVWEEVVGTARAKWLLWTGAEIDAQTALEWGVVAEVVPHDQALDRGIEIARSLARKSPTYLSLQKETLNLNLRRRIVSDLPVGMAYEGLSAADSPWPRPSSSSPD